MHAYNQDPTVTLTPAEMAHWRQVGKDAARRGKTKLLAHDPSRSKQENREFEYILEGYLSEPRGLALMLSRQAIKRRRDVALEDAGIDRFSSLGQRLLSRPAELQKKIHEMGRSHGRPQFTAQDVTFLSMCGIGGI